MSVKPIETIKRCFHFLLSKLSQISAILLIVVMLKSVFCILSFLKRLNRIFSWFHLSHSLKKLQDISSKLIKRFFDNKFGIFYFYIFTIFKRLVIDRYMFLMQIIIIPNILLLCSYELNAMRKSSWSGESECPF